VAVAPGLVRVNSLLVMFCRINNMVPINFDHSYTEDIKHKFFKALGRAGFRLSEHQVAHPGKHSCRFIMFERVAGRMAYLEFVDVGRGGKSVNKPGISLRCSGPLKQYFAGVNKQKGVAAKYLHRNYDWKSDAKSKLPGWNFMTFSRPRFKNIYPWFTEYEPRPGVKRLPVPIHPNTAQSISGVVLSMREQDKLGLEKVFGRRLTGKLINLGGIRLFIEPAKTTKISALVVKCKNLALFMRVARIKSPVIWQGKEAVVIRNPDNRMWDIIVVGR